MKIVSRWVSDECAPASVNDLETIDDEFARPPRLTLTFAVATALALSISAIGVLLLVRDRATNSAERSAEQRAHLVAESILQRELTPHDRASPATPARAQELDRIVFGPLRTTAGVVRATIFSRTGRILYSSNPSLIGGFPKDLDHVEDAVAGRVSREVSSLDADQAGRDRRKVLEVYVPIAGDQSNPPGAFEVYEDYARVSADVRRTITPVGGLLALVAFGLFSTLFPSLRRVTRTLEQRNRRAQEHAVQLRDTLIERERAATALAVSETRLRLMLRQLPALVLTADTSMFVTSADGRGLMELLPPDATVLGRQLKDVLNVDVTAEVIEAHATALRGASSGCELIWYGHTLSAHVEPLRDSKNDVVGTVCLALDVTTERSAEAEHLRLEGQLRQSQKLEAVGQLAAGIAHDFNNVLTVVRGYAELLHLSLAEDDPHRLLSSEVLAASDRAGALTGRLLSFSRQEVIAPQVADLNGLVNNVQPLLSPILGAQIHVQIELHPEPLRFAGDPGQIEQAIVNLALNARDAMPRGGTLSISTSPVGDRRPAELPEGAFVQVAVSDTGVGMTDDVRQQIFEPFFTTKEVGQGTGLGLASVRRTVGQAHGYVTVTSEPRVGSTFTLCLPTVESDVGTSFDERTEPSVHGDGEVILLVEDEEGVREFAARALRDHGYHVLVAKDGAQGLAVADDHAGPIDLLISDVALPWVPGPELAGMLRDNRPNLPVLFISGHPGDQLNADSLDNVATRFLPKPFGVRNLLTSVRAILERAGSTAHHKV